MVSNLAANTATLLSAMMGTIGTIWAVGLALYVFIYSYFEDHVLGDLQDLEFRQRNMGKDKETQVWLSGKRQEADNRLRNYERVFTGYLISGALTAISIVVSGATIAYDRPDWVLYAGIAFLIALAWLVILLSFEVYTSLRQVRRHRAELRV